MPASSCIPCTANSFLVSSVLFTSWWRHLFISTSLEDCQIWQHPGLNICLSVVQGHKAAGKRTEALMHSMCLQLLFEAG